MPNAATEPATTPCTSLFASAVRLGYNTASPRTDMFRIAEPMKLRNLVLLIALAALLAGCGVRGALEPPADASTYNPDEPAAVDPLIKPE